MPFSHPCHPPHTHPCHPPPTHPLPSTSHPPGPSGPPPLRLPRRWQLDGGRTAMHQPKAQAAMRARLPVRPGAATRGRPSVHRGPPAVEITRGVRGAHACCSSPAMPSLPYAHTSLGRRPRGMVFEWFHAFPSLGRPRGMVSHLPSLGRPRGRYSRSMRDLPRWVTSKNTSSSTTRGSPSPSYRPW